MTWMGSPGPAKNHPWTQMATTDIFSTLPMSKNRYSPTISHGWWLGRGESQPALPLQRQEAPATCGGYHTGDPLGGPSAATRPAVAVSGPLGPDAWTSRAGWLAVVRAVPASLEGEPRVSLCRASEIHAALKSA